MTCLVYFMCLVLLSLSCLVQCQADDAPASAGGATSAGGAPASADGAATSAGGTPPSAGGAPASAGGATTGTDSATPSAGGATSAGGAPASAGGATSAGGAPASAGGATAGAGSATPSAGDATTGAGSATASAGDSNSTTDKDASATGGKKNDSMPSVFEFCSYIVAQDSSSMTGKGKNMPSPDQYCKHVGNVQKNKLWQSSGASGQCEGGAANSNETAKILKNIDELEKKVANLSAIGDEFKELQKNYTKLSENFTTVEKKVTAINDMLKVAEFKSRKCSLGMKNRDIIPDDKITASSQFDPNHAPKYGRRDTKMGGSCQGAWCARENNKNQWIQVDLGKPKTVYGIVTQGRNQVLQWLKTFSVDCGETEETLTPIQDNLNETLIFSGNIENEKKVDNWFPLAMTCQFIRVHPVTWQWHIAVRMDLYGSCDE